MNNMNELAKLKLQPSQRQNFPIAKCMRKILFNKLDNYKSNPNSRNIRNIIHHYPITIFSKPQGIFLSKKQFISQSKWFDKQSAHIDEVEKWIDETYYLSVHMEENPFIQKVFEKYNTNLLIFNTSDKEINSFQNIINNAKTNLQFHAENKHYSIIDELNQALGLVSQPHYQKQKYYVVLKDDFLNFIHELDKKLKFEVKVDVQLDGKSLDYPNACQILFSTKTYKRIIYNNKNYTQKVMMFVQAYPELFEQELLKFISTKQIHLKQVLLS